MNATLGTVGNRLMWAAWHLLAAVVVPLAAFELRLDARFWDLPADQQRLPVYLGLVYLAVAAVLTWQTLRARARFRHVFLIVSFGYAALYIALFAAGERPSRIVLIIATVLACVLASLSLEMMRRSYKVLLPALFAAAAGLAIPGSALDPRVRSDTVLQTIFHPVRLRIHDGLVPSLRTGGAIRAAGEHFLVATGDGQLLYVEGLVSGEAGPVRALPYGVPVNRADFTDGGGDESATFRVLDILIQERGGGLRLLASHHYGSVRDQCAVVRVSAIEATLPALLEGSAGDWETLYETDACLAFDAGLNLNRSGGRMTELDDGAILLTIGDHAMDGVVGEPNLPQDPRSHYGKTIRIDPDTARAEIFTLGHRNAQGLHQSADGRIWLTEHGPTGGDELNLIVRSANYGWPRVSYGKNYDGTSDGHHAGYAKPVFAWLPAIGVSQVIAVQGDLFPRWKGDLLVASLEAQSLFRLRIEDEAVVFAERMRIGRRVRDIVEARDGKIVLLLDGGAIGVLEPGSG